MKVCAKCKSSQPVEEFGKDRQRPDGVSSYCKACLRMRSAAQRASDPEKARRATRKSQMKHPEVHLAGVRAYRARTVEHRTALGKKWAERNPEKWREIRSRADKKRYDAMKAAFVEEVVPSVVYERSAWVCGICGLAIEKGLAYLHPMAATVDHLTPISLGGVDSYANVQAAHRRCNSRKNAKIKGVSA